MCSRFKTQSALHEQLRVLCPLGLLLAFSCIASPTFGLPPRFTVRDSVQRLTYGPDRVGGHKGTAAERLDPWSYCPRGEYVHRMWAQLSTTIGREVTALHFLCTDGTSIPKEQQEHDGAFDRRPPGRNRGRSLGVGCGSTGRVVGFQLQRAQAGGRLGAVAGVALFCLSDDQDLSVEWIGRQGWDQEPLLCEDGGYACGVQILRFGGEEGAHLGGLNMRCCQRRTQPPFDPFDPRNVKGRLLTLFPGDSAQFDSSPYWHEWRFCPAGAFAVGIQLAHESRSVRLLCAPPSDLGDLTTVDHMTRESEVYSPKLICPDGFAIGFQAELSASEWVTNMRLFCSASASASLTPIRTAGGFKILTSSNNQNGSDSFISRPLLCDRNQAVCGVRLVHSDHTDPHYRLLNVKLRCCAVPDLAQICAPSDELELVVECDARASYTTTSCAYRKRVGFSSMHSITEGQRRERDLRFGLGVGREVREGGSHSRSRGSTWGTTRTDGQADSGSMSDTQGRSQGSSSTTLNAFSGAWSSSGSISQFRTLSSSDTRNTGSVDSRSHSSALQRISGLSHTDSNSFRRGGLDTVTVGNTRELSSLESLSHSGMRTDEQSSNRGSSSTSSSSVGSGTSSSHRASSSDSQSSSRRDASSSGMEHGWNVDTSVSAEASVNFIVSASLKTTFSAGAHGSYRSDSERARETSNRRSQERGSELSISQTNEKSSGQTMGSTQGSTSSRVRGTVEGSSSGRGSTHSQDDTSAADREQTEDSARQMNTQNSDSESRTSDEVVSGSESNTRTNTSASGTGLSKDIGGSVRAQHDTRTLQSLSESLNQILGWSTEASRQSLERVGALSSVAHSHTGTQGRTESWQRGLTLGFDWSRSSSETFNREQEMYVELQVAPGVVTRLYQVVGHCSYYSVRPNVFYIHDYGKPLQLVVEEGERKLDELRELERELLDAEAFPPEAGIGGEEVPPGEEDGDLQLAQPPEDDSAV